MNIKDMPLGACLFISILMTSFSNALAQPVDVKVTRSTTLEAYVDGLVSVMMEEHHIPGLTIAIVQNGEVRLLKGRGFADLEQNIAVDPNLHLFRIGSVTKTMTYTALMQLVEQGRVKLDDDVNSYLSTFQIPDTFDEPVRIRDLMAHRPGFEEVYRGLWAKSESDYESLEAWLKGNIPKRVFAPGEVTSYSNFGAALAGYIVEEVSGMSFDEYLESEIFTPLNMRSTTTRQPWNGDNAKLMASNLRDRLAAVYTWNGSVLQPRKFEFVVGAPAGSVSSTAADMAEYMRAHLNEGSIDGNGILGREAAQSMRARIYNDRQSADYASGFRTGKIGQYETFEHGGATLTSYSSMLMVPSLEIGVFISTNGGDDPFAPQNMARRIAAYLADAEESNASSVEPISNSDLEKFSGAYMTTRREYTGALKLLAAFSGISSVSVSPNNTLLVARGANSAEYVPISGDTFRNVATGETISFVSDTNGVPLRFNNEYGNSTNIRATSSENPQLLFMAMGSALLFAFTNLLSAWKRRAESKPESAWTSGLHRLSFVAATGVFVVIGLFIFMLAQITALGNGLLFAWPLNSATWFLTAVMALLALGALMLAGLAPAVRARGFSLWRKAHYLLFTLALLFLFAQLNAWNLIGLKYW